MADEGRRVQLALPSPTNTTPLMSCRKAPMIDGKRAACRTSASGVKSPRSGNPRICNAPSAPPSSAPDTSGLCAVSAHLSR